MSWILKATLATGAITVIVIGCTADMRDLNTCHAATIAYCEKVQSCDQAFAKRFPDGVESCATQVVTAFRVGKYSVDANSSCPDSAKGCSDDIEASACNAKVPDSCGTVINTLGFSTASIPVVNTGTSGGLSSGSTSGFPGTSSGSSGKVGTSSGSTGTSSGTAPGTSSGSSGSSSGGSSCADNGSSCQTSGTCTSQRDCYCKQANAAQCLINDGCYKEASPKSSVTKAQLLANCQSANEAASAAGGGPCVTCGP
jgi:hypothetical protein